MKQLKSIQHYNEYSYAYYGPNDLSLLLKVIYEIFHASDYKLFSLIPEEQQRSVFNIIEECQELGEFITFSSGGDGDHTHALLTLYPLYKKWLSEESDRENIAININMFENEVVMGFKQCTDLLKHIPPSSLAIIEYNFSNDFGHINSYLNLYTTEGLEKSLTKEKSKLEELISNKSSRASSFGKRVEKLEHMTLSDLLNEERNMFGREHSIHICHDSINNTWPVPGNKLIEKQCISIARNIIQEHISMLKGPWGCKGAELRVWGLTHDSHCEKYTI